MVKNNHALKHKKTTTNKKITKEKELIQTAD